MSNHYEIQQEVESGIQRAAIQRQSDKDMNNAFGLAAIVAVLALAVLFIFWFAVAFVQVAFWMALVGGAVWLEFAAGVALWKWKQVSVLLLLPALAGDYYLAGYAWLQCQHAAWAAFSGFWRALGHLQA